MVSSDQKTSSIKSLGEAVVVVCLVISGEYFFRHYVLFWLPTIGSLPVNDMLALFLIYSLLTASLGWLLHIHWRQELADVWRALSQGVTSWNFTLWILALAVCIEALPFLDRLLWGSLKLPMVVNAYRSTTLWLASFALPLKATSYLLVNGVFVTVAEEFLWRGVVQVRLARILPTPFAIGLTAVLFSLKHALVDASFGRLLTLTAFGVICGIVAQRKSWHDSAAMHIVVNTAFTVIGLVLGQI